MAGALDRVEALGRLLRLLLELMLHREITILRLVQDVQQILRAVCATLLNHISLVADGYGIGHWSQHSSLYLPSVDILDWRVLYLVLYHINDRLLYLLNWVEIL